MIIHLDGVGKMYSGSEPSLRGTKLEVRGPALWVRNAARGLRPTAVATRPVVGLSNCTMSVASGEIVGILGHNGSGKTTLIKMLAGLIRPTTGTGQVAGYPLSETREIRRRVSYVSTLGWMGLEWALTAEENVRFFALLTGMPGKLARMRTAEALRDLDLWEDRTKLISALSNGMRQRVIMARALLWRTPVVLLDEPLVGLDLHHREALLQVINHNLRERGQTVLLTDHDADAVASIADRVILLANGGIAAQGTVPELLESLGGVRRVEILTQGSGIAEEPVPASVWRLERVPRPGPLGQVHWRVLLNASQELALMDLIAWLENAGLTIVELAEHPPSLQDVVENGVMQPGRVTA